MPQDTFSFNTNLVDWNGLKNKFLKGGGSKGGLEVSRRNKVNIGILLTSEAGGNGCRRTNRCFEVIKVIESTDFTAAYISGRMQC